MQDGRTVRSTFTSDANKTVTVIAEPYRVPKGAAIQGTSNDAARWRTVEPRYVVSPASTSMPVRTVAPLQPSPPSVNRLPVSTTAVSPTIVYYVQDSNGQVLQAPVGSAAAPPSSIYDVLGAGTEVTQSPVIVSPAPPIAVQETMYPVGPPHKIHKPVLPIRRNINGAYVSQGLWGQPKAYVSREPVRNFFRYLFP